MDPAAAAPGPGNAESKVKAGDEPAAWYLFSDSNELLAGPRRRRPNLAKELPERAGARGRQVLGRVQGEVVLACGIEEDDQPDGKKSCPGLNAIPATTYYYLYKYQPTNTGRPDPGADAERPEVVFYIDGTNADLVQDIRS